MNEENFKALLKKSEITTSEEFTDKLMSKLEAEKRPLETTRLVSLKYVFLPVSFLMIIIGLTLHLGNFPSLSIANLKTFFFVGMLFFVLMGLNRILEVHNSVRNVMG